MMITWRKRGARILATWFLGFGSSLVAMTPIQPNFLTWLSLSSFGGMITAIPQISKIFSDYSEVTK